MFPRPDDDPSPPPLDGAASLTPTPRPEPAAELDEEEAVVAAFASSLIGMRRGHNVLFDAADGMRGDLRRRGWSKEAAEALTFLWTQRVLTNITPLIEGTPA